MANTKSSKKNIRVTERKTAINKARKSKIKTSFKKVINEINAGDEKTARENFVKFESEIMKGVSKGVYKKNTASRKLKRVAGQIRKLSKKEA